MALAQSRANPLHPLDLLLLTNFVTANGSFRQSESFSPVCLPRFNSSGFLHAYINYISQVKHSVSLQAPGSATSPFPKYACVHSQGQMGIGTLALLHEPSKPHTTLESTDAQW